MTTGMAPRVADAWHAAATLAVVIALAGCASTPNPWPERVVGTEQMRPLTPLKTSVLYNKQLVERGGFSTVILRLHVDSDGRTQRVVLHQSSGIVALDEAALHVAREARFTPYANNGVTEAVTLLLPMHYPLRKRTF